MPNQVKELAAGQDECCIHRTMGHLLHASPTLLLLLLSHDTKELYTVSHSILMTNCHQGTFLPHFTETWGADITSPELKEPVQGSPNLNPPT